MNMFKTLSGAVIAAAISILLVGTAWADTITPAAMARAGARASLTFEVSNDTAAKHTYDLSARGLPAGVDVTFVESGPVVAKLGVGARSSVPVTLRAVIPVDAKVAKYKGAFLVTRDDGAKVQTPFSLSVSNKYALKIASISKNISAFSGQDLTLDVTVANSGAAVATNLTPSLNIPSKWVLTSSPEFVRNLSPGQEAVFHLKVAVPASQVAIYQPVSVAVASDQVTSPASSVSVRVQNNPAYLPIAGAVVLVALVALVVYFRRKGRR